MTAQDADGNTVSDAFDVEVVGPPSPVSGLSCVATTDRVLFTWDAPEWSGAQVYAYDYDLTRPDGGREQGPAPGLPGGERQGRLAGGPAGQHQREGGVRAGRRERGVQRSGDAELHRGGVTRRLRGAGPGVD